MNFQNTWQLRVNNYTIAHRCRSVLFDARLQTFLVLSSATKLSEAAAPVGKLVDPAQKRGTKSKRTRKHRQGDNAQHSHIGSDVSGTDSVHLYVVLAPFIAERFRKLAERALSRCISRHREPSLRIRQMEGRAR